MSGPSSEVPTPPRAVAAHRPTWFAWASTAVLVAALVGLGVASEARPDGRALEFALWLGVALGVVLQRSRFCFFCHARDYFEGGDSRGLLAILLALSVGTVGMHLVLGSWLPIPAPGRLPPTAHIGPVSWALVLAGLAFGGGMVISGSCISAHWYRLGEGSRTAPFALIGAAIGFVVGFSTWNTLYALTVASAVPFWLPHWVGYGSSMLIHLLAFAALAAWCWRRSARPEAPELRAGGANSTARVLGPDRWPYWVGGLAVGWLSTLTLLRLSPLGVTAALGSAARQAGGALGWMPKRLEGLDGLAGCATTPDVPVWHTPNGLLIVGLVAGSFGAALLSGQFRPRLPRVSNVVRGLGGGILLGWGAMTGLGCTIGTLLSGTTAGALAGWVFGASVLVSVWVGLRVGLAPRRARRDPSRSPGGVTDAPGSADRKH